MISYKEIGERIKIKRDKKGWTQSCLAGKVNVSTSVISRIERGTLHSLDLELLRAIASVLNIQLSYLLCGDLINISYSPNNSTIEKINELLTSESDVHKGKILEIIKILITYDANHMDA